MALPDNCDRHFNTEPRTSATSICNNHAVVQAPKLTLCNKSHLLGHSFRNVGRCRRKFVDIYLRVCGALSCFYPLLFQDKYANIFFFRHRIAYWEAGKSLRLRLEVRCGADQDSITFPRGRSGKGAICSSLWRFLLQDSSRDIQHFKNGMLLCLGFAPRYYGALQHAIRS